MPWTIQLRGDQYCVYREEEGEPTGEPLGCHIDRDRAVAQIAALEANVEEKSYRISSTIRVIKRDGEWILEVLGAPHFGPEEGKDLHGEFFSPKTDFMLQVGDKRPVVYFHGDTPEGQQDPTPEVIGVATASRRDSMGQWFEVVLDKTKSLAERIWNAAREGVAAASTGSIPHLIRRAMTGELLVWPIAELTLLDVGDGRMPANEWATVHIRTIYKESGIKLPEAFVEAEQVKADAGEVRADYSPNVAENLFELRRKNERGT